MISSELFFHKSCNVRMLKRVIIINVNELPLKITYAMFRTMYELTEDNFKYYNDCQ